MDDTILEVLLTERARLTRTLGRRFPRSSEQVVEDAVSDAIAAALIKPAPFERALANNGREGVRCMFYCVARRRHQDATKRMGALVLSYEARDHGDHVEPAQHATLRLRQVDDLIDQACMRFGHGRDSRLREALVERFRTGDSDTSVARSFGLPREYLNRARCFIQQALEQ